MRTLFISQFLMLLALEMSNPFLPLFIAKQNLSLDKVAFYSALVFVLPMLANIFMGPIWGILANRIGYKTMLMRAALTLVITQGLMMFSNSIIAILIIRCIQGGFAGFIAAMQMYVLSLNIANNKTQQLGHLQFSKALATSMAGLIGGSLLSLLNFKGLFFIAMALCLTATLIIYKKLPTSESTIIPFQQKKQFRSLHSFFRLMNLGLLIILTQTVKFLPEPIFILTLSTSITHNTITLGLLYSMPAIGLFLSSNYCSKQFDQCRKMPKKIKTYLIFYSSLGILIMLGHAFFTEHTLLMMFIRLLWGIVLAALLPALFCLMSDKFQHQGLAIGWANTFAKIGNLIGISLGGVLGSYITMTYLFILLAGIYGAIAFISLCFNTKSIATTYINQQALPVT